MSNLETSSATFFPNSQLIYLLLLTTNTTVAFKQLPKCYPNFSSTTAAMKPASFSSSARSVRNCQRR